MKYIAISHDMYYTDSKNRYTGREVVILDYTISITNKCNLKCSYCYERHLNTEYGCINDETRDKIADYIKSQNNAGTVYLFGGEPLPCLLLECPSRAGGTLFSAPLLIKPYGILSIKIIHNWPDLSSGFG